MRMVEYFPEKDIKAYLGGEADELMFGHSVSGYGMSNDQYEVREVPDLIPQQFMSAAGLTGWGCSATSSRRRSIRTARTRRSRRRSGG